MNRLDTSSASTTNGFPPKQGTWDFLQDANKEIFAQTMIGLIGKTYSSSVPYILYGCESSVSGGNTNFTSGAIFFNGEVYVSPAQTIVTPSGSNVIIMNKVTTNYTINADPVQYSGGGAPVNCHNIVRLGFASGLTGTGNIADFSTCVPLDKLWVNLTLYNSGGTVAWSSANVAFYDAAFQDRGNTVQLCGVITSSAVAGALPMFTLPVGSRPSKLSHIWAMVTTSVSSTLRLITVAPSGECSVSCDSNTGGITVYLDGIIFRKK